MKKTSSYNDKYLFRCFLIRLGLSGDELRIADKFFLADLPEIAHGKDDFMFGASKQLVDRLREEYPAGTRVELIQMEDEYSRLNPGDKGTVTGVDDIGTIHVDWDCGFGLGIAYGEDLCRRVSK